MGSFLLFKIQYFMEFIEKEEEMILPYQKLKDMIFGNSPMIISNGSNIKESQVQPATIDCRLGTRVYRMSAAMFPKPGESVNNLIEKYCRFDFELKEDSILEPNAIYIVPLQEGFNLTDEFSAFFSPKSSTGRTDVFVRVLSNDMQHYDVVRPGYRGEIYLEIVPLSFSVGIKPSLELVQFRIRVQDKSRFLCDNDLRLLHAKHGLIYSNDGKVIPVQDAKLHNSGLYFHVDLKRDIVGFQALSNPIDKIDLFRTNHYESEDFWIPIHSKNGEIVLQPGCFYLLASKEKVKIPQECAAEISIFEASIGEFRSHYAGFFDNAFGGELGTNVVLEVRARDVPCRIYDGQPICKMNFEMTTEIPEKLYGQTGSNYTGSGPSLSKHFKKIEW
ncbi:MAG: 2'-deoxycytidine 5'-triphosphate deaminase [Candidatus Paceibacteria bacterium]